MSFSALVLAGSRPGAPDPVAVSEGIVHKALAELGGETMLARVVAVLREAGASRIAVATGEAPVAALAAELGCEIVPARAGPSASVAAGLEHLDLPILVTTADHALLQASWVTDFIAGTPDDADVSIMLASREAVEQALPGSKRTWLRMADGQWSGCNLFMLKGAGAHRAIETWKSVEADRKRPWRIAVRLGPAIFLRYLVGKLTMAEAIARLGRKIGIAARLVPARDGLAAVDVDTPQDLANARAVIAARG